MQYMVSGEFKYVNANKLIFLLYKQYGFTSDWGNDTNIFIELLFKMLKNHALLYANQDFTLCQGEMISVVTC